MRLAMANWQARSRLLIVALLVGCSMLAAGATEKDVTERSELSVLLGNEVDAGFAKVTEPRSFAFPRDHGPHSEYRNEWWYMTGNLDDVNGRRFGFELTIFRFALTSQALESRSDWRTNQVYIAHFALTDADRERFYMAQRFSRGALGLAGAQAEPFRVWIDDWKIFAARSNSGAASPGNTARWRLNASDDEFALELMLVAEKAPVLNGINGLSQKSDDAGNASYYYSITRWRTDGRVRIGADTFNVSGLSWLDREWSSSALAADQKGWDWFALQLSDGSELMFYNLRKGDGTQDGYSAGTLISAEGIARHLHRDEISISVADNWESPKGGNYPAAWDLRLPEYDLSMRITPVLDDQELFTTVRYWEGAVDVAGTRDGAEIDGRGYVELTGYAEFRED